MPEHIEREVIQTTGTPSGAERQTVRTTDEPKPSGGVLAGRIIYWILGVLEALLTFRFVLALLGANRDNPFAQFIFNTSAPFAQPFFSLFGYQPTYGASHVELGTAIAMIFYAIVAVGIVAALRLPRRGNDI
jgi:hypothetical protein